MTFAELLVQVRELVQSKGRVSYRALKLQFNLDDEYLDGIKDELIEAERVAADEDGKVLVWVGAAAVPSSESRVPSSPQSLAPNPQPLAERRQLTVMFCDLVGSTALSAQLDPEELREVVRSYQQTSATVIERFGGHIAQYLGDGLLVYFGYPVAHEDDAARAVRAGLEIVEAIRLQVTGDEGHGRRQPLQVRIGIHTGPVVVGEMGGGSKRELLALGETPNLAARIQGQAAPNEVVISTSTYRLVEGLFACEDRGQPELKGISTPLTLYRVVKESQAQSRFEVVVRRGLTPLIGREHEFGLLHERWEQAKSGEGQVVLLSGEPGIGKSRLVEALKETVKHEGTSCLELRCSPYHQNSALYPVIAHVQRVLRFQSGDSSEEKLQKLEASLVGAHGRAPLHELVPLFASLLLLPLPERYPPLSLSPQKQKEKTLDALVDWLCAEAKQQAVVFAWEDLHWADPSTLELLTLFLNQVPTTQLLTVLIFRPEFISPWGTHSYLSQLTLSRLGRTHVETIVEKVASGKALPREVVQQIVSKTDGVPLFVEELTKTVIESAGSIESGEKLGQSSLQFGIPSTLQDALMARLDRLGPAKEIAQLGAAIGREFSYELLQAVSPLAEEILQHGLKQLIEAELVYQRGLVPQAHYLFKHALIQDMAYQSLLKSTRQQLHQQIAHALETQFPDTKETQPELLAQHYTEAGLIEKAIPYWQQAGQQAVQRSANVEAVTHLSKALELLKALPDTPERTQQELALQIALGVPLTVTKGYGTPEVEAAATRALELCKQIGETPLIIPALFQGWWLYIFRGEFQMARELAEHLTSVAQRVDDSVALAVGYRLLAQMYLWGEVVSARAHLEQALALYDPQQCRSLIARFGVDWGVNSFALLAHVLWVLGYPDQARTRSRAGLIIVQEVAHPLTTALFCGWNTMLHQVLGEVQVVQQRAEALLALSNEQGFPQWSAYGVLFRGWALVMQGQARDGLNQIHQGVARSAPVPPDVRFALLAEAYGKVGQAEKGLTTLTEGLETVSRTGWRMYEAELYRLKGELTLQEASQKSKSKRQKQSCRVGNAHQSVSIVEAVTVGDAHPTKESEAEACFLKALDIARKQQAKSLELRASTSLARLWQQQGKQKEAHHMLADIYHWFTEGFDTKDLQEAKALLEELSH